MASKQNILSGPSDVEFDTGIGLVPKMFHSLKKATKDAFHINIDTHEKITYEQLWYNTIRIASAFQSFGLGFGKVVAIVGRYDLEVYSVYFGAVFSGASVGCLNPAFKSVEINQILVNLKPEFIYCSEETFGEVVLAVEGLQKRPVIIVNDGTAPHLNYRDLLTYNPDGFCLPKLESWDDHIVSILLSSGTTGLPKGVQVRDKALQFFQQRCIPNHLKVRLCHFPISAGSSLIFMTSTMKDSGTFVWGGNDNAAVINALRKYKPNYWFNTPTNLLRLAQEQGVTHEDFSSVECMFCSGAGCARDQMIHLNKTLFNNRIGIINSYNSTEAFGVTSWAEGNDLINSPKLGSVGKLLPFVQLKIVHTESREVLGHNCEGELYVKTPFVMAGYINCPKETAEALDAEGWYRTGDLGYYDEDGYVFISGRAKEVFKCMNLQVSPMLLEAILEQHPAVREAAVVGKPHPTDGYHPTAFVALKKNAQVEGNELIKFVNDQVADFRKLRGGLYFVDEIPKNPSGKKMRAVLLKTHGYLYLQCQ